eukprot:1132012-Amphidinium_carterae.1
MRSPKTRRVAREQHARFSDGLAVLLASWMHSRLDSSAQLLPMSTSAFRRRWLPLMTALRVPNGEELRPTAGSLRGSGATHFLMVTEDIGRLHCEDDIMA